HAAGCSASPLFRQHEHLQQLPCRFRGVLLRRQESEAGRMIRQIQSLARDEGGASIIEMGLMLPILASLLIGMVDISRAYSAKLQLEQSAYRAIEKVQQYNTTEDTYNTLKSEAASAARGAGFTTVTDSDVTIDYWLECNGTRAANYDTVCSSG